MRPSLWIAAALVALAGCAAPAPHAQPAPAGVLAAPSAALPDTTRARLEALYRARRDRDLATAHPADVAFMTGMVGHHAQALILAAMAPTHGANASIQTLAARIDNAQRDEIAAMQRWLRDRGQPVPEVHIMGTTLMIHGVGGHDMSHGAMDHSAMPGMLTDAQLAELDAARGAAFDRLFLTFMMQHHGGALVMVDELFAADGAALDDAAFKLASDIAVDQRTEIARMQRMLDGLPRP
jgi:uncharacterized protein (DUF305 family)